MLRLTIFVWLAAVAFAQQDVSELFNKPPADVDKALRERVTQFFQYHVIGQQARKAESLVAEDSKDYFYDHNKPRYISFEIVRIQYSDNFKTAKVTCNAEQQIMQPGFDGRVMKIPTPSMWKLIDGLWYWWIDPASITMTPAGSMVAGPFTKTGGTTIPAIPGNMEQVFALIKTDKSSVALGKGDTDQVQIANGMPGPVTIAVDSKPDGVEVTLDASLIKPSGKITASLKAVDGLKAGTIQLRVTETGQKIPIEVTVK